MTVKAVKVHSHKYSIRVPNNRIYSSPSTNNISLDRGWYHYHLPFSWKYKQFCAFRLPLMHFQKKLCLVKALQTREGCQVCAWWLTRCEGSARLGLPTSCPPVVLVPTTPCAQLPTIQLPFWSWVTAAPGNQGCWIIRSSEKFPFHFFLWVNLFQNIR